MLLGLPQMSYNRRMAGTEHIDISLSPDVAAIMHHAVENGEYLSNSDVVRDALLEWQAKRLVRSLWQEGIESGSAGVLDMAAIKREARQNFEQRSGNSEN